MALEINSNIKNNGKQLIQGEYMLKKVKELLFPTPIIVINEEIAKPKAKRAAAKKIVKKAPVKKAPAKKAPVKKKVNKKSK